MADAELGEALAGGGDLLAGVVLQLGQCVPRGLCGDRMGRSKGAGTAEQPVAQPVVGIEPRRLWIHQPVILP